MKVKKDFALYNNLLKLGGLMIFHDIVPHRNDKV